MAEMRRDATKEAFWRDAIRRQADGGRSVREFCRTHGLSEPSFYGWRRTLRGRDARRTTSTPAFVPVIVRDGRPAGAPADGSLVIELRGGRALRLPGSMAVDRVVELVRALEAEEATA